MAIFESTIFNAIRGALAGTVFFTTPSGAIIGRAKTIPVNPNTARQTLVRTAFSDAVGAWKLLLQADRDGWDAYALATYSPVKGRQTFIGAYSLALYMAHIDAAPITPGTDFPVLPGVLPVGLITTGAPGGPAQTGITVSIVNPNSDDVACLIEISEAQDPSRERFKGPFKSADSQVVTLTALATTGTNFLTLEEDAKYFFRVRAIAEEEPLIRSTEFFTSGIAIAVV